MAPVESSWLKGQIDELKKTIRDYANAHAGSAMNEKYSEDMKTMQQLMATTQAQYRDQDAYRVLRDLQGDVQTLKDVVGVGLDKLAAQQKETKDRLDLLTEAIAVSHMKDDADKCIRGCWACHVIDVMKGLKAARTLMGEAE
jgi:hypothetical protein